VPLKELKPNKPEDVIKDLYKTMDAKDAQDANKRGQIVLELTYKPFKKDYKDDDDPLEAGGGLLVVTVYEADALEGRHMYNNPCVKIIFKAHVQQS
jgi:hypothetical protein